MLGEHFLQTTHWAAFQNALGVRTKRFETPSWSALVLLEKTAFGTRLYCPYGPTAQDTDSLKDALAHIEAFGKSQGALVVRVEPACTQADDATAVREALEQVGYRRTSFMQPTDTLRLDLTLSEEQLMRKMDGNNRRHYRKMQARGLRSEISTDPADVPELLRLLHETEAKGTFSAHEDDYLTTQATVLMERGAAHLHLIKNEEDEVLGASLVHTDDERGYYAHTASSSKHRKLNPGSPLVSSIIFDCKKRGLKEFDFVGITTSDDPEHPWAGFTGFKKRFGGDHVQFAGTWEKPLKSAIFKVYDYARTRGTTRRPIAS